MIHPITRQKSVSWVNFMQQWLNVAQLFRLSIFDPMGQCRVKLLPIVFEWNARHFASLPFRPHF